MTEPEQRDEQTEPAAEGSPADEPAAAADAQPAPTSEARAAGNATGPEPREADAPKAKREKSKKKSGDAGSEPPASPAWTPTGAVSLRAGCALSVLAGFLYFLGFPGMDIWPLSLVALVPLIVAMRGQPPRRTTLFGWLAGFTMTMVGFYWLLSMLKVFSGFGTPLCIVFMAILCGYQGGRIGLCGWLYGRAATRGWPAAPVFALAFAASELVYPLLFPWYFGASVHNALPLMQVADLGGPILVGLVLVASNLAIAELVLARREKRAADRRLVGVGLAVPAFAAAYGAVRMHFVRAAMEAAPRATIGIVQPNLALFDRRQSVLLHLDMTRKLREQHVDLVIFSEAGISKAFLEPRYQDEVSRGFAKSLGVPTIIGTLLVRPSPIDPKTGKPGKPAWFNTALMADEKGAISGRYDKQYLLAFGEYIPFGDTFPVLYTMSPNSSRFSPGSSIDPLVWGEHRISALICYEDILPSFVNAVVSHADPDLLVNMTNDAWFGDSTEPWIHLALAKLRAVEHRRYLVRATNSGVSAIVDATGGVVIHGGTFHDETVVGDVRFLRSKTVFELVGDAPWWLATLAIAAMAFLSAPARFRARPKASAPS